MKIENSFCSFVDEVIKDVFCETTGLHLQNCRGNNIAQDDVCTVHTIFHGGYEARLAFCAQRSMMKRITENMLEEPVVDAEDIVEYMKELLNILCGHVVAAVFHMTKTAARFQPPCFAEGRYLPEGADPDAMVHICYMNDYAESAILLHDQFPRGANEM